MVVGNVPEAADLLVVGAGPGGYHAALHAARAGRRVLLVDERGEAGVGGVCLRVGCIPSKALIEVAEQRVRAGEARAMGLHGPPATLHMDEFQVWKNAIIERLTGGVNGLLRAAGVSVRRGRLRLTGPGSAVLSDGEGGAQFVDFRHCVLATGSRPAPLAALPVDGVRVLDSTALLALDRLPASVAVIGAGYIGLELGMALARLGVATTLVEAGPRLLPALPAELLGPVERRLGELGVQVLLDAEAVDLDARHLAVRQNGETLRVAAEQVVVAVGRLPNSDELGLAEAGLECDARGLLAVGPDRLLSARIAAVGDLTPGPALAHKASAEAAVAVDALAGRPAAFEPAAIPAVVFCDPEIASVGLSAEAARAAGADVAQTRLALGASGRAATLGRTAGFAWLVTDRADGTVLGVHLVGAHASELIGEAALAIELGACAEDLALTIHPHPTLSEQLAEVAARLGRAGS